MSLFDELKADQRKVGITCSTCIFISAQPVEREETAPSQEDWRGAFLDRSYSTSSLVRRVAFYGGIAGESSISKHRKEGHK